LLGKTEKIKLKIQILNLKIEKLKILTIDSQSSW